MSDESSDEYHEDSLPDLILSSSLGGDLSSYSLSSSSLLAFSAPDLLATGPDDLTDIEAEYFTSGDQARTTFSLLLGITEKIQHLISFLLWSIMEMTTFSLSVGNIKSYMVIFICVFGVPEENTTFCNLGVGHVF